MFNKPKFVMLFSVRIYVSCIKNIFNCVYFGDNEEEIKNVVP